MTSTVYVIAWCNSWDGALRQTVRTGSTPVNALLQITELKDYWANAGLDLEAEEASGDPAHIIEILNDAEIDLSIVPYENLVNRTLPAE